MWFQSYSHLNLDFMCKLSIFQLCLNFKTTLVEHSIRLECNISQTDQRYEVSSEVRGQIKFLEELDKLEKKRHEDAEREVLLRAAKVTAFLSEEQWTKGPTLMHCCAINSLFH